MYRSTVGGGGGAPTFTISIASPANEQDLRTLFNAGGYAGETDAVMNATIENGVLLGSTTDVSPSLTTGDFGSGSILNLTNLGKISGKGGNNPSGNGGDALDIGYGGPINITNASGFIQGGGGAGAPGSPGSPQNPPKEPTVPGCPGGGGGGGAGDDIGTGSGSAATVDTGGGGAGSPGCPGSAGEPGNAGGNRGVASNGAAGKAIELNGNPSPTFVSGGVPSTDIFGAVS